MTTSTDANPKRERPTRICISVTPEALKKIDEARNNGLFPRDRTTFVKDAIAAYVAGNTKR